MARHRSMGALASEAGMLLLFGNKGEPDRSGGRLLGADGIELPI